MSVQWRPYFLSVNTPEEGEDLEEHLMKKYGRQAVERFRAAGNPLDTAGAKVGIRFNNSRRFVNTMDSHRLMEWCNGVHPEKADSLMESLFHAYFEEAIDISKRDQLVAVAVTAGLNAATVGEMLNSSAFRDEVLLFDRLAKSQLKVSGVPFFIIEDGKGGRPTAFSGAQVS